MLWLHIPDPLWLIIGILATFRLASIIHSERIGRPFRSLLGVVEIETDDGVAMSYPDTFVGHLIECFWCTSVWVGAGVGAYLCFVVPFPLGLLLLPFALSAGAIMIHSMIMR